MYTFLDHGIKILQIFKVSLRNVFQSLKYFKSRDRQVDKRSRRKVIVGLRVLCKFSYRSCKNNEIIYDDGKKSNAQKKPIPLWTLVVMPSLC